MPVKNPFSIIGLSPDFVRSLNAVQLTTILGHYSKGLASSFHPEGKSPDQKRFNETRQAIEELKDPKDRDEWRRQYIKKTPVRVRMDEMDVACDTALETIKSQSKRQEQFILAAFGFGSCLNIFHCEGIWVSDIMSQSRLGTGKKGAIPPRSVFRLSIDAGLITKEYVSREKQSDPGYIASTEKPANTRIFGAIPDATVIQVFHNRANMMSILFSENPAEDSTRIGTKKVATRKLPNCISLKNQKNRIAMSVFRDSILPYLTPSLEDASTIFGLNMVGTKEAFVSIEGVVICRPPEGIDIT